MTITVRAMTADDWPTVESIYREGIATGNATFEASPPSWEEFDRDKVASPRLVAVDGDQVVGWAAAASLAISAGANVKAVRRMLGRASAAMTLDTYADPFDDDLDAVSDRPDEVRSRRIASKK